MPEAEAPSPGERNGAARDDDALVRRARAGDRRACETLFERHRGMAYRVAFSRLGNEADALDAVQDGFLKAFVALGDFDGRSGFRTWLVKVVFNAALDLGRKRGRRAAHGLSGGAGFGPPSNDPENGRDHAFEPATEDDPARGLHRQDLRRTLDAALDRLSPPIRETFVLVAEVGLSYKEAAEVQHVPIGTVMSRVSTARTKLQAILKLEGIDDPES